MNKLYVFNSEMATTIFDDLLYNLKLNMMGQIKN